MNTQRWQRRGGRVDEHGNSEGLEEDFGERFGPAFDKRGYLQGRFLPYGEYDGRGFVGVDEDWLHFQHHRPPPTHKGGPPSA